MHGIGMGQTLRNFLRHTGANLAERLITA
jgi:hypothetical protein